MKTMCVFTTSMLCPDVPSSSSFYSILCSDRQWNDVRATVCASRNAKIECIFHHTWETKHEKKNSTVASICTIWSSHWDIVIFAVKDLTMMGFLNIDVIDMVRHPVFFIPISFFACFPKNIIIIMVILLLHRGEGVILLHFSLHVSWVLYIPWWRYGHRRHHGDHGEAVSFLLFFFACFMVGGVVWPCFFPACIFHCSHQCQSSHTHTHVCVCVCPMFCFFAWCVHVYTLACMYVLVQYKLIGRIRSKWPTLTVNTHTHTHYIYTHKCMHTHTHTHTHHTTLVCAGYNRSDQS